MTDRYELPDTGYTVDEDAAELAAGLPALEDMLLAGQDWTTVPEAYGRGFVEVAKAWVTRLHTHAAPPQAILDEIYADLAARENAYPKTTLWDQARAFLVMQLDNSNYPAEALDLLATMSRRHYMAVIFSELLEPTGEEGYENPGALEANGLLLTSFLRRFRGDAAHVTRGIGFLQAMADLSIERSPLDPTPDLWQRLLTASTPDYDPFQSWVESQRDLLEPDILQTIINLVTAELIWEGVPMRYRQYAAKLNHKVLMSIHAEVSAEPLDEILGVLDKSQEHFPDARAWDILRTSLAETLIKLGFPAFALDFGRSMQNSEHQHALVLKLIETGYTDVAQTLAPTIVDPRFRAAAVLAVDIAMGQGRLETP